MRRVRVLVNVLVQMFCRDFRCFHNLLGAQYVNENEDCNKIVRGGL